MSKGLVCGVGVYTKGKYPCSIACKSTKHYQVWYSMLQRCYSPIVQEMRPTYLGCTVSDNFKNFQFFAEWCEGQAGFNLPDYHLDKDVINRGNKQYCPEYCAFIPKEINLLFTDRSRDRGLYPVGVCWHKLIGKFQASISKEGKKCSLGYYNLLGDAELAYKVAKESYIKEVANKYKDTLDIRVYTALLSWKIQ